MKSKKGSDLLDTYSTPVRKIKTRLSYIFEMRVKETVQKRGRSLGIVWDKRTPLIEGFENNYSYIVKFNEVGIAAGNHYHYEKQELFYPIIGRFKVILKNIETKEQEEIEVDSEQHQVIYFPTKIAHAVVALTNPAIILIIASSASKEEDEIPHQLT